MKHWHKCALYVIGIAAASSLLIQIFQLFLPVTDINWPISLGWGSMLIPPLILTALRIKQDPKPFFAVLACAMAWVSGYFLHFDATNNFRGFDMWAHIGIYSALTYWCWALMEQRRIGQMGCVMVMFGVVMTVVCGRYVNTQDHFWWRLGLDICYGLMLLPPAFEYFDHDPKTEERQPVRHRWEQHKKAA